MTFSLSTEKIYDLSGPGFSAMKRLVDMIGASLGLLVFSPVLLLVALLVRWKLGGPVIFRQERPGLGGHPFTLYKFRTMTEARGQDGDLLSDEQRLTHFGRFLRVTSLDELPELFNVLRGDMSLVGPRPLLMRYLPYFEAEENERFNVRPGITGLAQVSGRNNLSWDQRIALDVHYARNHSLGMDFKIILTTLWKVLSKDGVKADTGIDQLDFDAERRLKTRASDNESN